MLEHAHDVIRKRKSIRKYDMEPLDAGTLEIVATQIKALRPLFPNIDYAVEIANKTKGLFNVKAPHYLLFSSQIADGAYENIGFIGQQMDLFFASMGIGACWLGASKPMQDTKITAPEDSTLSLVICMAFGQPAQPLYRTLQQFKRKPLHAISQGHDKRLEAARLAPSAINGQNWYFVAEGDKIYCYRKKLNPIQALIYDKMVDIDMGIAICHIAAESADFCFIKETNAPERSGYVYMGTVC